MTVLNNLSAKTMNLFQSTQKKIEKGTKTLSKAITLKSYRKLAINFLILTVNLIIIILYFTLSQAKIIIVPEKEAITHKMQIPIQETVVAGVKAIAGKVVEQTVTTIETFNIASESEIPAQATGQITIYNKTASRSQQLVANTQFATPAGVVIRLKEGVTVKAGENVTVAAYADQEGKEGEVEPGQFEIVKLKSDKDKIYGEVTAKFTGGTTSIKMVSQETLDKAQKEVEAKLKKQAAEKMEVLAPEAKADEISIVITSFKPSAKVGDTNLDSFTIAAEAVGRVIVFDKEAAKSIIKQDLAENTAPNKMVSEIDDDSFKAAPDSGATYLDASIEATLIPKFADAVFKKKDIMGLNRDEVRKYFRKITGIDNVDVKFSPFWVRSVPNLEDHVDIEIKK